MIHKLKILPEYFIDIVEGRKTFEVRKNDRDYKVGDILILHNYYPDIDFYDINGAYIECIVSYIIDLTEIGIKGYVAMGIKEVKIIW